MSLTSCFVILPIHLFDIKILLNTIESIDAITKEKKDTRIFVKGDRNVSYGKIVETMAEIHNAGFTKVALISDIKHK